MISQPNANGIRSFLNPKRNFPGMTVLLWMNTLICVSFAEPTATGSGFPLAALSMKMMKSSAENAISPIFQAVESALMRILQWSNGHPHRPRLASVKM